MSVILLYVCWVAAISVGYRAVCAKFKYDPAVEFAMGFHTGDYKLASLKFLEIVVINFLVATGIKYSLLAVLEFLIFVGVLIG